MAYVSPGVYTIEKDISEYTPSVNTSIVGIVGFAQKGPTNKATLITSQNQLLRTFGEPAEAIDGQAIEGALEILETTNQLYFVRASDSSLETDASATMALGVCPSVIVSGAATAAECADSGWGVKDGGNIGGTILLRVQVYDNDGTAQYTDNNSAGRDFLIPAGTSETSQAAALKSVIGGDLDADKVGVQLANGSLTDGLNLSGMLVGSYAGSGASLGVSACSGVTTFTEASGVSALQACLAISGAQAGGFANYGVSGNFASAVRVYGASYSSTGPVGVAYSVQSLYPGTGYNGGTRTDGTASGNSVTITPVGGQNFDININENGTAQETFKTSFVGSGAFVEDVINTGETNLTSDIIKGFIVKNDADVTATSVTSFLGNMATIAASTDFGMHTQWL